MLSIFLPSVILIFLFFTTFFIIALSVPNGFWFIISPLTITLLLLFISGVPMLEKKFTDNPKFQEYARVTPKFFPWFPKKTNHS